jgi:ABC-type branched-subunit amino acid transport system substrate-binding protein
MWMTCSAWRTTRAEGRAAGLGHQLVEDKSYPGGVKDLSPVLRSMKDKNPDAFVGFTYPPDTILASKQAKEVGFNPKFFYASVGTAFQLYKNVMTPAGAEGVLGMGSRGTARPARAPRRTSMRTPRSSAARSRTAGPAAPAGPGWRS